MDDEFPVAEVVLVGNAHLLPSRLSGLSDVAPVCSYVKIT